MGCAKTALELMRVAFSIPAQEYKNEGQKKILNMILFLFCADA